MIQRNVTKHATGLSDMLNPPPQTKNENTHMKCQQLVRNATWKVIVLYDHVQSPFLYAKATFKGAGDGIPTL